MRPGQNIKRARSLRKTANTPEQIAWATLRSFRKLGFPVRRQHPIGRYIVDFAIVKEKIAIEIDGAIHNLPEVAERDAVREKVIRDDGWRMLRVSTDVAMSHDHLSALIQQALGLSQLSTTPSPLTPLPLAGEGNKGAL